MAVRTKEEAAEIAASWWAEKVARPVYNAGADSMAMVMAEVMATVNATKVEETEQERFKKILKKKILEKIENAKYTFGIHCDYAPEGILSEAMMEASIPTSNAPWKTSMWIDADGTVSVKHGYGRGVVDL